MSYDAALTITIPASLYDVAKAIARAMDPDVGGYESYGPRTHMDAEGNEYTPDTYTMSTPCRAEFKQQAIYLMANPTALHQAVSADYATRWPDHVPPTLAECEAFCAGAVIEMPPEVTLGQPETPDAN